MMGSAQTGSSIACTSVRPFGTTLPANPATMPQKAPASVMRRLQTLMKATGPQEDAKTVPAKYVIQKMLGGTNMASASAAIPTTSMVQRLIQSFAASLAVPGFATSWLALKATRERNVVADDRPAATIPARTTTPAAVGIRCWAAQIIALSAGATRSLARLIAAPQNISAGYRRSNAAPAPQPARITTCSLRAIRYRLACQGLTATTTDQASPRMTAHVRASPGVAQLAPGPVSPCQEMIPGLPSKVARASTAANQPPAAPTT